MERTDDRPFVFISYRRAPDGNLAARLAVELKQRGFETRLDLKNEAPGPYPATFETWIHSASAFVLLLSKHTFESPRDPDWIVREVELASQHGVPIVPFLDHVEMSDVPLPTAIASVGLLQGTPFHKQFDSESFERCAKMLRAAIKLRASRPVARRPSVQPNANAGRDAHIERMLTGRKLLGEVEPLLAGLLNIVLPFALSIALLACAMSFMPGSNLNVLVPMLATLLVTAGWLGVRAIRRRKAAVVAANLRRCEAAPGFDLAAFLDTVLPPEDGRPPGIPEVTLHFSPPLPAAKDLRDQLYSLESNVDMLEVDPGRFVLTRPFMTYAAMLEWMPRFLDAVVIPLANAGHAPERVELAWQPVDSRDSR